MDVAVIERGDGTLGATYYIEGNNMHHEPYTRCYDVTVGSVKQACDYAKNSLSREIANVWYRDKTYTWHAIVGRLPEKQEESE